MQYISNSKAARIPISRQVGQSSQIQDVADTAAERRASVLFGRVSPDLEMDPNYWDSHKNNFIEFDISPVKQLPGSYKAEMEQSQP